MYRKSMDLIRIFYSTLDIQPERILRHFLGSIGFYVEEIADTTCPDKNPSVADIYIISNEYASDFLNLLEDYEIDEDKSVFIFKNGWDADGLDGAYTYYYDNLEEYGGTDEKDEKEFLEFLIGTLDSIMVNSGISEDRMIRCDEKWDLIVSKVADEYIDKKIPKYVQYTKYFYRHPELFQMTFRSYVDYISKLEHMLVVYEYSPLLHYIITYAKYELDYICRQNLYECYYDPEELCIVCNFLLMHYGQNEELWFLRADIHYDLQGKWQQACTEYQDVRVSHCAYGDYKCGRILREYLKEYKKAIVVLQRAIALKPDYYAAWYHLAAAYEASGKYRIAIQYCEYIIEMLDKKYKRHLLSPLELEYFHKTIIKIIMISQYYLGDKATADSYAKLAEDVKKEANDNTYLQCIWPEILEKEELVQIIRNEIRMRLNEPYEESGLDARKIREKLYEATEKKN